MVCQEKAHRSQWLDALALFHGLRSTETGRMEISTEVVQQVMAACAKVGLFVGPKG